MFDALSIGGGILWTLAYLLIIKRGQQDRTFGMPLVALCANLSWEFIFSFMYPHPSPQRYINVVWFSFDILIVGGLLKYGPAEFPYWPKPLFYSALLLALVPSFCAVLFITYEFSDYDAVYSAFGQNLMMSILFVDMLLRRNSLRGQSLYIALFKMMGTILPAIAFGLVYPRSVLLGFLCVCIVVFDVIYVIAIYRKCLKLGVNPWRRW